MSADRTMRLDRRVLGVRATGDLTMLGLGVAFLALFSMASIFAGPQDPRRGADPRDDLAWWIRLR